MSLIQAVKGAAPAGYGGSIRDSCIGVQGILVMQISGTKLGVMSKASTGRDSGVTADGIAWSHAGAALV